MNPKQNNTQQDDKPDQALEKAYPVFIEQDLIWGDMDAFEHVNNTVYFRYFEDVRFKYFQQIDLKAEPGLKPDQGTHTQTNTPNPQPTLLRPILAAISCDFKAPLIYPDRLKIGATITAMGNKSITMCYIVFSDKLNKAVATGQSTAVLYNHTTQRSLPIPEKIRAQIRAIEHSKEL